LGNPSEGAAWVHVVVLAGVTLLFTAVSIRRLARVGWRLLLTRTFFSILFGQGVAAHRTALLSIKQAALNVMMLRLVVCLRSARCVTWVRWRCCSHSKAAACKRRPKVWAAGFHRDSGLLAVLA